jgi:hypothetical protein
VFHDGAFRCFTGMRNSEGMPDHYAVYEDGKYVGDKPVGKQ